MEDLTKNFSNEILLKYLDKPHELDLQQQKQIQNELLKIGIDLKYRQHLQQFDKDTDLFGIILDRDYKSHTRELMAFCHNKCLENNIQCYITNPCFEFWLLLHVCDICNEFSNNELDDILNNPRLSNKHTKVSKELSSRTGHSKSISSHVFNTYYFPNILTAIKNSEKFAMTYPDLLDNLGTNLPYLFKELGYSI